MAGSQTLQRSLRCSVCGNKLLEPEKDSYKKANYWCILLLPDESIVRSVCPRCRRAGHFAFDNDFLRNLSEEEKDFLDKYIEQLNNNL